MAITISGQNNNDRILASDGVLDSISGFNVVGVMTAGQFDVTGKTTTNHISIGSNIHLGNAGIITATTLLGNVTGNINHESNLLLQISGSEKFRVGNGGQFGIAGANYGTAGQVFTSGGSGSAPTWSTIASDKIQEGNTFAEVIDTGSNGVFTVSTEGNERLRVSAEGNVTVGAAVTISPVGNINATGIVTATSFSGSGANLTSLPAQATIANNADNRVITGGSGVNLNGEANLTFDGATLDIDGGSTDTPLIIDTTSNNGAHLRFRKDGSNQHFIGAGGGFSLGDKEDLSLRAYDNLLFATGNSSTEKVRISQTGSLGIGTAAPQVQTHIFGADAELLIERGGYSEAELWLGFPSGQPFIASGPGKGLKLGGNGKWNEGLHIASDGNVHVNMTDNGTASAKLNVEDNSSAGTNVLLISNKPSGANGKARMVFHTETSSGQGCSPYIQSVSGADAGPNANNNQNAGGFEFHTRSGGSGTDNNAMRIRDDGTVEKYGSVGQILLKPSGAEIEFTRGSSSNILCSNTNGYLNFFTSGQTTYPAMRIFTTPSVESGAKVGINTDTIGVDAQMYVASRPGQPGLYSSYGMRLNPNGDSNNRISNATGVYALTKSITADNSWHTVAIGRYHAATVTIRVGDASSKRSMFINYDLTAPNYGVAHYNIIANNGNWNTGSSDFQIAGSGSYDYALQVKHSSYYNSSNNSGVYMIFNVA